MEKAKLVFAAANLVAATAFGYVSERCSPKSVVRGAPICPALVSTNAAGHVLVDFGRHAFGWLEADVAVTGKYTVIWGELVDAGGSVVTNRRFTVDEGTVRCACTKGEFIRTGIQRIPYVNANDSVYFGKDEPDGAPVGDFGTIMPFRWVEIVETPTPDICRSIRQIPVWYPYDMDEESFVSSSLALNKVHDFCKYSILATSFLGRFVDGDRERLTYEADSLIAQLGSYAMSSDYGLPRRTLDWVSDHSTWPTEWKQYFVRMCWLDWMYTGDTSRISRYYDLMKNHRMWSDCTRESDGLLVTDYKKTGDINRPRDIVDWAMCYRDGFVFTNVNAIVNALRYSNLRDMADMAGAIGRETDAEWFAEEAERVRHAYLKTFVDMKTGLIRDGEGVDHFTVQANAVAITTGVLPKEYHKRVADYVCRKGMSCSTYMAQHVLEALCMAGRVDEALALMTSSDERGWLAMMSKGATITMEFWDLTLKEKWRVPDMNHAWSTAPLNVIVRCILGVMPLEPGFEKISVKPRLGSLSLVNARIPTASGTVSLRIGNTGSMYYVELDSPAPVRFEAFNSVRELSAGHHQFNISALRHYRTTPTPQHKERACRRSLAPRL